MEANKMAKNVMKGNFKTLLKNFCLESSVLGLKYFYLYPDRISRCFWAVSLLLLLMFACLMTALLYSRFGESPTRITIENQYQPLDSLPYPAIAICSPNQISIASMEHLNKTLVDGNVTIDLNKALPLLLGFYEAIEPGEIDDTLLQRLQALINENRYTEPEVMGLVPQSCGDFLKMCIFKMKRYKCHELFRPLLTLHGLCCVFNSPYHFKDNKKNDKDLSFEPHMGTTLGLADALRVVVDYEPESAVDFTVVQAGGIRVMFTDWSEFPADDESALVGPNKEAFLLIHGIYTYCSDEVASLPSSSRQCYFEDEQRLMHFIKYHKTDCEHLCFVETLQSRCGCVPMFLPRFRGSDRVCSITDIRCLVGAKVLSSRSNSSKKCDCPRDCNSRRYTSDMMLGNVHGLPHLTYNLYEGISFKNSTAIINMYFAGPVYVKRKQETVMSIISLASNLGGIFGLCLGCSVISVLEIMFYIGKAIQNHLTRRFQRKVGHVRQYSDK